MNFGVPAVDDGVVGGGRAPTAIAMPSLPPLGETVSSVPATDTGELRRLFLGHIKLDDDSAGLIVATGSPVMFAVLQSPTEVHPAMA